MWTKFLFAPAVVTSGQLQRTSGAKEDPFVNLVALAEPLQLAKKISACLGMVTSQTIGLHRLTMKVKQYYRVFGHAATPTV